MLLILVLGVYLRLTGLIKNTLSYDEIASFSIAAQSFPVGILEKLANCDTQAPLYYLILNIWMKITGISEFNLRFLSVIFGSLNIMAVYWTGRKLLSPHVGFIAAGLMAINSMQIYYSQEIRCYSFVSLLSIISVYFFLKILQGQTHKNFIGLLLINTALLYTSNIAQLFVASECLIIFSVLLFKKEFCALKTFILYQFLCLFLYLPHLILLFQQMKNYELMRFSVGKISSIGAQINDLLSPYFSLTDNYFNNPYLFKIFSIFFVFIPILIFCISLFRSILNKTSCFSLIALVILFFTLEYLLMLNQKMPAISRYAIFVSPVLILIWAKGLTSFKNKIVYSFFILSTFGISLFYLFFIPLAPMNLTRSDFYKKAALIIKNNKFTTNDIILDIGIGNNFLKEYYKHFFNINSKMPEFDILQSLSGKKYDNLNYLGDEEFVEKLDRQKVKYQLIPYFKQIEPTEKFEDYIKEKFLNQLSAGDKIALITNQNIRSYNENLFTNTKISNDSIKIAYFSKLFVSKFNTDFIKVCKKNLVLVNLVKNNGQEVYIFKKVNIAKNGKL